MFHVHVKIWTYHMSLFIPLSYPQGGGVEGGHSSMKCPEVCVGGLKI